MQPIKANIVRGGEAMENALLFQQPSQAMINYIQENLQPIYDAGSNYSQLFKDNVQNMYNANLSQDALLNAQILLSQAGTALGENAIVELTPDQIPYANFKMQQYIMACPQIQEKYKRNLCHGFQETYYNPEPDTYGEDRRDYQRVMDGIMQYDENGEGYVMYYSTDDDEEELTFYQKVSILNTWHNVKNLLSTGKDPTDPLS